MTSKIFNPSKSFLHLPIVWFAIVILFILAIVFGAVITAHTPLVWDFRSDGFNLFISTFRFPLGILALVIPIVALLAANHRSEQTKEQIRITGLQNNFANYYKHLEEFVKFSDKYPDVKSIDFRYAHKKLYPNSQSGDYSICPMLIGLLEQMQKMPYHLYDKYPDDVKADLDKDEYKSYVELLKNIVIYIDKENYKYLPEHELFGSFSSTYLVKSMRLLDKIIELCKLVETLCSFSMDFESKAKGLTSVHFQVSDFGISKDSDSQQNVYDFASERSFNKANEHFKKSLREMKAVT